MLRRSSRLKEEILPADFLLNSRSSEAIRLAAQGLVDDLLEILQTVRA